jgi:Ni/Co efflux regulator RcnB
MKFKVIAAAFVVAGVVALMAAPASAQTGQTNQPKKKTVVYNRDHTVMVSRDEDGRTRTRIIVQKRSYLDPGTESFPGERGRNTDYVENPNQRAGSVINNTSAGLYNTQSALPGPWTLPSKNNPWLGY